MPMASVITGFDADAMSMPMGSEVTGLDGDVMDMPFGSVLDLLDGVPPVIAFQTPAGALPAANDVEVDVTDDQGVFVSIVIEAAYTPSNLVQTVYSGGAFTPLYDDASTEAPIVNGSKFNVFQDAPGWWEDFTLTVRATDIAGNTTVSSRAFTVPDGPGAPGAGGIRDLPPLPRITPGT
jgi:hypothetical protein